LEDNQISLDNARIQLTAALAGDNQLPTKDKALIIEQRIVDSEPDLMALIRGNRMKHDRRDVLLKPTNLSYEVCDDAITLKFSLTSGSFATSLVRELIEEIPVERQFD
jgi:tRNA pseudouridine13 synthase